MIKHRKFIDFFFSKEKNKEIERLKGLTSSKGNEVNNLMNKIAELESKINSLNSQLDASKVDELKKKILFKKNVISLIKIFFTRTITISSSKKIKVLKRRSHH